VPAREADAPAVPSGAEEQADATDAEDKRRDRRIATRMPGTLWCENRHQSLACTIRDKSSTGARLEIAADRFADAMKGLAVGAKLSLVFNSAGPERTSVSCVVVWIDGRSCGVRFVGQFSRMNTRKTPAPDKSAPGESAATKPTKATFAPTAWRRPQAS
jgi:hypothetical protein